MTRTTDDHQSQCDEDILMNQVTTHEVLLTTQVMTLDIFTTDVMTCGNILTTLHDDQEMTQN